MLDEIRYLLPPSVILSGAKNNLSSSSVAKDLGGASGICKRFLTRYLQRIQTILIGKGNVIRPSVGADVLDSPSNPGT